VGLCLWPYGVPRGGGAETFSTLLVHLLFSFIVDILLRYEVYYINALLFIVWYSGDTTPCRMT